MLAGIREGWITSAPAQVPETVASHELTELLQRLQARHDHKAGEASVSEVAEAAGCHPDEVLRELQAMRAEQVPVPAPPRAEDVNYRSTSVVDGYIETVEYRRTRTPAALGYVFLALFLVAFFVIGNTMCTTARSIDTLRPSSGFPFSGEPRTIIRDQNGREIEDPMLKRIIEGQRNEPISSGPRFPGR